MKHPLIPLKPLVQIGAASHQTTLPDSFRVCVWNWHKCTERKWQEEFTALCREHDLFLAQEVRLEPAVLDTLKQSRFTWHTAAAFLSPLKKFPTGIAAGAQVAAEDISCQSMAREPLVGLPKMTLRLFYPMTHTRLCVINVHAVNFTGIKPFEKTLQYMAQLINDTKGPVLLAGDFNTWNTRRVQALQEMVTQLELTEVPFTPDTRTQYLRRPVDYLFIRGLEVLNAQVLPCASSDHRPLSAALRII